MIHKTAKEILKTEKDKLISKSKFDRDWELIAALDTAIEFLENDRPQGEWIPVGEGYPEEETDVLICNIDGDIIVSRGSFSTEIKDKFIWYTSGCG